MRRRDHEGSQAPCDQVEGRSEGEKNYTDDEEGNVRGEANEEAGESEEESARTREIDVHDCSRDGVFHVEKFANEGKDDNEHNKVDKSFDGEEDTGLVKVSLVSVKGRGVKEIVTWQRTNVPDQYSKEIVSRHTRPAGSSVIERQYYL